VTAKIIPFPARRTPPPLVCEVLTTEGTVLRVECSEGMHYFTDRRETCQCGKERWPE
jgi:hypothetical protein